MVAPPVTEAVYGTDLFEVSGPVSPVDAVQVLLLLLELFLQKKLTEINSNKINIIFTSGDFIILGLIILVIIMDLKTVSFVKVILK